MTLHKIDMCPRVPFKANGTNELLDTVKRLCDVLAKTQDLVIELNNEVVELKRKMPS